MLEKFEKYLLNEKRKSPCTARSYVHAAKAFRRYIQRDYILASDIDLRRFKKHLVFKGLKSSTINQRLFSLRSLYEWLVLDGQIARNPVGRDLFFKAPPPQVVDVPTEDDISKMINSIQYALDQKMLKRQMAMDLRLQKLKNEIMEREKVAFDEASGNALFKTLRDKFMVAALASSGLRISELMGLTVGDIEEDGGIHVRRGKGGADRYAFMDARARKIYGEYRDMLAKRGQKRLYTFTYRQAWNIIKGHARRAGIGKNLYPHSFRHYFVTTMGRRGMSDTDLAKFTGHRNMNTLARYKNYNREVQREVYEKYQGQKKEEK